MSQSKEHGAGGQLIKVCGLSREEDAAMLSRHGVNFGGVVLFFPKSKRNQEITQGGKIAKALNQAGIKSVAVTVSPNKEQVEAIEAAGFQYLQVHGELAQDVYETTSLPVIRAFNQDATEAALDELLNETKVAGILLDAKEPGSGVAFSWKEAEGIVKKIKAAGKLFFLAGGIGAGNVKEAIKALSPDVIDVSSSVEIEGRVEKSEAKIEALTMRLKTEMF